MHRWTPEDVRAMYDAASGGFAALSRAKKRTYLRIVAAATERFTVHGYRRTAMDDIARDAGVAKGTLYTYFPAKRDLLIACVTNEKLTMLPEIEAALKLPPKQQLRAFIRTTVHFALHAPLTSRLVNGDAELTALFDEMGVDAAEAGRAQGLSLITPMVQAANPALSDDECARITRVLSALLTSTVRLKDPVLGADALIDEIPDLLADLLAAGVAGMDPR